MALFSVCTGVINVKCTVTVIVVCILVCLLACCVLGLSIWCCYKDFDKRHNSYLRRRESIRSSDLDHYV